MATFGCCHGFAQSGCTVTAERRLFSPTLREERGGWGTLIVERVSHPPNGLIPFSGRLAVLILLPAKNNCMGLPRIALIKRDNSLSSGGEAHYTAVVRFKSPSGIACCEWAQERIYPDTHCLQYSLQPIETILRRRRI